MYQSGIDLAQAAVICGYDMEFLADAGLMNDCAQDIGPAALSALSAALGNAYTKGIAESSFQPWVIGWDDSIWQLMAPGGNTSAGNTIVAGPGGAISEI